MMMVASSLKVSQFFLRYLNFYNLNSSMYHPTLTWKVKIVSHTVGFCPDTCDGSEIFISMLMVLQLDYEKYVNCMNDSIVK